VALTSDSASATVSSSVWHAVRRLLAVVVLLESAGVALRYLLQVFLARNAGVTQFGVYRFAYSWGTLLAIPAGLGLPAAMIRYLPAYIADRDWPRLRGLLRFASRLTLLTGGVVALVSIGVTLAIGVGTTTRSAFLVALASIPLLGLFLLQSEALRGAHRVVGARFVPNVAQPVLVAAVVGVVALVRDNVSGVQILAAFALSYPICIGVQALLLWRPHAAEDVRSPRTSERREWLAVSWTLFLVKSAQLVLNQSDIALVGVLSGVKAAGIYAAASRTAAFAGFGYTAVNLGTTPAVSRSWAAGDRTEMQMLLRRAARVSFIPTAALTVLLIAFSEQLLRLFGSGFVSGRTVLLILVAGYAVNAIAGPVGSVLTITGHQTINAWVYGSAAVVQIVLYVALIPWLGITGAAIANMSTTIAWNLALFVVVQRLLHIRLWPIPLGATRA
jgi:O-antigen/teichoic acid export membrane protein